MQKKRYSVELELDDDIDEIELKSEIEKLIVSRIQEKKRNDLRKHIQEKKQQLRDLTRNVPSISLTIQGVSDEHRI